jgi:hypothetical protein
LLVVTIGGMPMFTRRISYSGCVVAELSGPSGNILQSSRDGLKWPQAGELDSFVSDLSVNRQKALRQPVTQIFHYPGHKLAGAAAVSSPHEGSGQTVATSRVISGTSGPVAGGLPGPSISPYSTVPNVTFSRIAAVGTGLSAPRVPPFEFVAKNDTGMAIPSFYLPEAFSAYSRMLVRCWASILLEMAALSGRQEAFALGFYFSAELEAAHEESRDYGHILFVNPIIVTDNTGGSRSLRRRWKFNASGRWQLVATALHEWIHFEGFRDHNEDYSTRLSDLTAIVLQNVKRFGRLFNSG